MQYRWALTAAVALLLAGSLGTSTCALGAWFGGNATARMHSNACLLLITTPCAQMALPGAFQLVEVPIA